MFAARARSPRHIPGIIRRSELDTIRRDVMMAVFGLAHTSNTRVGDDFVRGVSGGERKRVSIAEAALTGARFQCWDNSTRGLDSANAINFCRHLRLQADLLDVTSVVTLYQAPQSAYDVSAGTPLCTHWALSHSSHSFLTKSLSYTRDGRSILVGRRMPRLISRIWASTVSRALLSESPAVSPDVLQALIDRRFPTS